MQAVEHAGYRPGEQMKYNQLLRIEEALGAQAIFPGREVLSLFLC